jgi:hypothetical protein
VKFRSISAFVLGFAAAFALTMNASAKASHPSILGAVLAVLVLGHLALRGRLWLHREFVLYLGFASYNALTLLWTGDESLGSKIVPLTLNFALVLILFSALIIYYDLRAVLTGMLGGFLIGVIMYTRSSGFPFVYPDDFSYNTIAGMYLFGLFMTVACGWCLRLKMLPIALGLVLLLLIAATTSIKTNLGILLGGSVAGLMYFKSSLRAALRYLVPGAVLVGAAAYAVTSNAALMERVQTGLTRVSMGAGVLVAREDRTGGAGLGLRKNWTGVGIEGWATNPLFGNGVEAFRADNGVTSHSTPVDLLYNTGLIGFTLFYGMLLSMAWRLSRSRGLRARYPRALLVAGLVCYTFISLSGTMYYDNFLAAFMAIGTALLTRPERKAAASAALLATANS